MNWAEFRPNPQACPHTRKELVWFLWNKGRTDCNLIKEGPFYAAWVGNQIRATGVRRIDSMSFERWEAAHFYITTRCWYESCPDAAQQAL